MYKLTVVMPALNEAENIDSALTNVTASFEKLNILGEIIVINDGSRDNTQAKIEEWIKDYSYIRFIRHETPMGIGASFWDGVLASDGEIVTMMPGDAENDSYEILRYLSLMEHVDIVIPHMYNASVRARSRVLLSRIYTSVMNLSFGLTLHYYNGTALYRRSVLKGMELRNPGFFYAAELLIKSIRRGYLYAEVPSALLSRKGGKSKAVSLKSLLAITGGYLSTLCSVRFGDSDRGHILSPDSMTALRVRCLPASEHADDVFAGVRRG
jgi:glycosyltransferase involved in cell wall biosynthesis